MFSFSFLCLKVRIFRLFLNIFTKGKYLCFQTSWNEISKMSMEILRWNVWKNEEEWAHIKNTRYSQTWIFFRGWCFSFPCNMFMPYPFINIIVFIKRWEYQTTWPASWEIYMQDKKKQLELGMKQQTGSKLGKQYVKAAYCYHAHLTYMQSTSCEMLGLLDAQAVIKIFKRNINILIYTEDTMLMAEI